MVRIEDVEALTCLGLSVLQAKVYLALTDLGNATVKAISKTSSVARQDIYRLISELQELGIVERILAIPNEFRALPMQDGIDILLQRSRRESSEAYTKAMDLLQRHKNENANGYPHKDAQFVMIPEKETLLLKLRKAIETSQNSVDTVCSWKKFSHGIGIMADAIEKALSRGVEFRTVIEKPLELNLLPKTLRVLVEHPSFKVRICPNPPAGIMGMYDKREMLLATSVEGSTAESSALWTNNTSLLVVSQGYFEATWAKAAKFRHHRKQRNTSDTITCQIVNRK